MVKDTASSSVIFDFRPTYLVEDAKHKNPTTTLNKELSGLNQRPALIDQQMMS